MKTKPKGLDRPSTVKVIKVLSAANTWAVSQDWRTYRRHVAGRRGIAQGVPICLLTTTGRKTGQPRTVPLCYLADGDRIVVVASQGGLPTDPLWYRNAVADPAVQVQIGRGVRLDASPHRQTR